MVALVRYWYCGLIPLTAVALRALPPVMREVLLWRAAFSRRKEPSERVERMLEAERGRKRRTGGRE